MDENIKYKICVRLPDTRPLTFNVDSYETIEGGLIKFYDKKFNKIKIFDSRLCEIEVIQNDY